MSIVQLAAFLLGAIPDGEFHLPPPPALPPASGESFFLVPPPPLQRVPEALPAGEGTRTDASLSRDGGAGQDARAPWVGAQLDAGVPDGVGASVVLRPWRGLRLHLGGLTNAASGGFRGGVTLAPFASPLAPTLTVEAGRMGQGDLSAAIRWVSAQPLLEGSFASGAYDFYGAYLGLEVGSPRRLVVFARAGLSRIDAILVGTPRMLGAGGTAVGLEPGELRLRLTMPSVKVGFTVYLGD